MDALYLPLRQVRLHGAIPDLTNSASFCELVTKAVRLGIDQLGLDHLSFWAIGDDGQSLRLVCRGNREEVEYVGLDESRAHDPTDDFVPVGEGQERLGYFVLDPKDELDADDRMIAAVLADTIGQLAHKVLAEESLRELFRITSSSELSREQRLVEVLQMGVRQFDLEIGILSHIIDGRYEIKHVVAPTDLELTSGMRFELRGTYCCDTLAASGPIGFTLARDSDWSQHPAYSGFGLEAYLGTPVRSGEATYGTLNFSSRTPRPRPFSAFEHELVQLMARWVQVELEQEQQERRIREHETLLAQRDRTDTAGELATSIAHELNQPLSALVTLADATRRAAESNRDPNVIIQDLHELEKQAHRASAIVRSLRSLIRRDPSSRERCQLGSIFDSLRAMLGRQLENHDIEFLVTLHDANRELEIDRVQVEQAFRNLIENSISAIDRSDPERRAIRIASRTVEESIELEVTDTAHLDEKIDPSQLLEAFFTTRRKGLGLGLAIVRSVVEAHTGRLTVDRSEAGGLRVRIRFDADRA